MTVDEILTEKIDLLDAEFVLSFPFKCFVSHTLSNEYKCLYINAMVIGNGEDKTCD